MAIRNAKEFSSLIQYYIACLAKEEALALTFDAQAEGSQYCVLPRQEVFSTENPTVSIETNDRLERFFARSHEKKQLYIAAPIVVDRDNKRIPVWPTGSQGFLVDRH